MTNSEEGPANPVLAENMRRLLGGRSIESLRVAMAEAGVPIGTGSLHRALLGEAGSRLETLKKIATFFDITVDQLLQQDLGLPSQADQLQPSSTQFRARGLPVVGTAKLGDDGLFHELEYPVGHGDGFIDWPSRDSNAYALRCKGDSMKPRIKHNEYVVIEPNHAVSPGDEVLVKAKDGRVMVKELAYVRDGLVHLLSVNESHPKVSIPQDEIEVMHYVAGIAKAALWQPDDAAAAASEAAARTYESLRMKPVVPKPPARKRSA